MMHRVQPHREMQQRYIKPEPLLSHDSYPAPPSPTPYYPHPPAPAVHASHYPLPSSYDAPHSPFALHDDLAYPSSYTPHSSYPPPHEDHHWLSPLQDDPPSSSSSSSASSYPPLASAYPSPSSSSATFDFSCNPHRPASPLPPPPDSHAFPMHAAPSSCIPRYYEDDLSHPSYSSSYPSDPDYPPSSRAFLPPPVVPLGPNPALSNPRPMAPVHRSTPPPHSPPPPPFNPPPRQSLTPHFSSTPAPQLAQSLRRHSVSAAPMPQPALTVTSSGAHASGLGRTRPSTTSPYDQGGCSPAVTSSPRYGGGGSTVSTASTASASPSTAVLSPPPAHVYARSVSQPASPCHSALSSPAVSAMVGGGLAYQQAVSATTLSHAAAPALSPPQPVGGGRKATAAIHLKAMPAAVRATSAASPPVVAATTLRSLPRPATPAKLSPAPSSSSISSRSPRAVHALPAVAVNVAAPALTIHSTDLTPTPHKKRRRADTKHTAYIRGSATDTSAASPAKHFTYDAAQLVMKAADVAHPHPHPPSSPLTLSTPYPRRRFSTVSTSSSISGASMGSEDSSSSLPAHQPGSSTPFLTTEDLARLTGPRVGRSQSICVTTAQVVSDMASKRRRSCAAVDLSTRAIPATTMPTMASSRGGVHHAHRPPSPSAIHPLSESALIGRVHLSNPLSRLMVVKGVEYLFASEHDKSQELVPSPSQISTGSEGSEGGSEGEGGGVGGGGAAGGWQGLGVRVRDYLRARFGAEGAGLVDECVGHVLFVHERGWKEYEHSDGWDKAGGGRVEDMVMGGVGVASGGVLAEMRMQRVTSDISGNISALSLSS